MNPFSFSDKEKQQKDLLFTASFFLSVFTHVRRHLSILTRSEKPERFLQEPEKLLTDFIAFKKLLQNLAYQNSSNQMPYLSELTETWRAIKADYRPIRPSGLNKHPVQTTIEHFLETLQNYPPHEDHSLGFYLSSYQQDTWTPFPFIDQLSKLHSLFQQDPSTNHLQSWILLIEEIIDDLEL